MTIELKLPLRIDRVNGFLKKSLWVTISLIAVFIGFYLLLLALAEPKESTSIFFVNFMSISFVVTISIFFASLITNVITPLIRGHYANTIIQWGQEKYGILLSKKDAVVLTKPVAISSDASKVVKFSSKVALAWNRNEQGLTFPSGLYLQGFRDGNYVLANAVDNYEILSKNQKESEKYLTSIKALAKNEGFYTFVKDGEEKVSSASLVNFNDPRLGKSLNVFWTDSLGIELYKNAHSLPNEIVFCQLFEFRKYLLPELIENNVDVGFNWAEDKPQVDIETLRLFF